MISSQFENNEEIDCSYTKLRNFKNIDIHGSRLVMLNCSNNLLTKIIGLPDTLRILDCSGNMIRTIEIPPNLIELNCSDNEIKKFANFPDTLVVIACSGNMISELILPSSVKHIDCSINDISKLVNLPPTLETLYCSFNKIREIQVPNTVIVLHCSNNYISEINIPPNLFEFDCSFNRIKKLVDLPFTLEIFDFQNNPSLFNEDLDGDDDGQLGFYDGDDIPDYIWPKTQAEIPDFRGWCAPRKLHFISQMEWPIIQLIFSKQLIIFDENYISSDKL